MAATNLLDKSQNKQLLQRIRTDYPDIRFKLGDKSLWDPSKDTIHYKKTSDGVSFWSLFHELGHMKARHNNYSFDLELLKIESEAWSHAQSIAKKYGIQIDKDYIEDCMDSYRDWIHKRSTCPKCKQTGAQQNSSDYICLNCSNQWSVTRSRFCRSYRKTKTTD